MQLPISLGNQGFASLRENQLFFILTKLILSVEWWDKITGCCNLDSLSPRRFEKNIKFKYDGMLLFLLNTKTPRIYLIAFSIWNNQKYQKLQGTYPVYLT